MHGAAKASASKSAMTRIVGLPLFEGFSAFARNGYAESVDAIEPVRDIAHRFGRSQAQRDLLTLTMIEASIRSGNQRRARHYIAERQMHKPTAWSERLLARAARAARASASAAETSARGGFTMPAPVAAMQS